ncbi:MAG: 16S rRNA (adenine(1518)-N(6)/adenine(1519)-N(6))-dimethyltransferase RsmA [Thermoplasmatota archaeon]
MGQRLGQHFLRDERTVRRIIDAAAIEPGMHVLEVGPGPGVLTEPLSEAVGPDGHVTAVEADLDLAAAMSGRYANVDVILQDVMKVDLRTLAPFDRIVSNLPYQISGPVTAAFLDVLATHPWGHAVLMYQKEFAERLLAGPGTKAYGRLSVQVARHCAIERVREVPPAAFDPPPKVRSLVVKLTPHEEPPFDVGDGALFTKIVDAAFAQRRKQLKNTLAGVHPHAADVVGSLGLATLRPEQVTPEDFAAIARALA